MKDRPDESMTTRRLSRRDFLGRAAAVAALTSVAGPLAACQPPEETGGAAGTDLDFVIWSYNVGTVQDNVNRFEYQTPMDVAYNGGNWLPEFAAAEWVVPLADHFAWVEDYRDKIFDFAWQDMSQEGKVYGLPYYADTQSFFYNEKILKD